jgi:ATP-dependent helicase Lhr and Lhr-like helicase
LDAHGQDALNDYRSNFRRIPCIQWNEEGQATWWTFAGGRINHTLKYGIQSRHDWTVRVDNFKLRIEGDSLGKGTLSTVIDRLLSPEYWQEATTQNYLLNNMPNYRFSKFQQVLPAQYAFETIRSYLLDIEGISKLRGYRIEEEEAPAQED